MGKSTINGPFSIAMLVHQRVLPSPNYLRESSHQFEVIIMGFTPWLRFSGIWQQRPSISIISTSSQVSFQLPYPIIYPPYPNPIPSPSPWHSTSRPVLGAVPDSQRSPAAAATGHAPQAAAPLCLNARRFHVGKWWKLMLSRFFWEHDYKLI